MTRSKISPEL